MNKEIESSAFFFSYWQLKINWNMPVHKHTSLYERISLTSNEYKQEDYGIWRCEPSVICI